MISRLFGAIAIATITTITTTSVTNYLLERPWCIHLDSSGKQTISYGDNDCIRTTRMANETSPSLYNLSKVNSRG
ncbi:MAG: hypothetical protein VKL39_14390 [Leptolyngbyaceae bacterium]|nr:hypothetical protein [Leptolyngbyaceae bacterium]